MDFGDLILIIFIVSGILSTLGGKKKKKAQGKGRPQARPLPRQAQFPQQRRAESAPEAGTTPSRAGMGAPEPRAPAPPARESAAPATMEDILRQLGLDLGPQPEVELEAAPEPEPEREPPPQVREVPARLPPDRVEREIPQVLSLEDESIDAVADRAGPRHREFHEEFVKPFRKTIIHEPRSRARIHLNPRSLREAVILKEILGPPKGMQ